MIGLRPIIRMVSPAENRASWKLWGGIGLLLGIVLGLSGFLLLQGAVWGVAWLAVFAALAWVGYQAEPVLEQKPPALPPGPHRVQDGPVWMIELPGGEFMMGASEGDENARENESPRHRVRLSRFRIMETPITAGLYGEIMGVSGEVGQNPQLPATEVSWEDAVEFCNRLSDKQGYRRCYRKRRGRWICNWGADGYRLPTEAEWEYACRAGSEGIYCFGDDQRLLDAYAWHSGNSGFQLQQVATRRPNAWGLYDMHGSVWEWCWDWYGPYSSTPVLDPRGPTSSNGGWRVLRGGSFGNSPVRLRSASRDAVVPEGRGWNRGFRCVRVVLPQPLSYWPFGSLF